MRGAPRHPALVAQHRTLTRLTQAAIDGLIAPCRAGTPAHARDAWRAAFAPAAPFRPSAEQRFATPSHSTSTGSSIALSISFIAALPGHERSSVEARVRELDQGAPLELRYMTEVGVYERRSGS